MLKDPMVPAGKCGCFPVFAEPCCFLTRPVGVLVLSPACLGSFSLHRVCCLQLSLALSPLHPGSVRDQYGVLGVGEAFLGSALSRSITTTSSVHIYCSAGRNTCIFIMCHKEIIFFLNTTPVGALTLPAPPPPPRAPQNTTSTEHNPRSPSPATAKLVAKQEGAARRRWHRGAGHGASAAHGLSGEECSPRRSGRKLTPRG